MSDIGETVELLTLAGVDSQLIEDNPEAVVFCSKLVNLIREKLAEQVVQKLLKQEPLASLMK